MADEYHQLQDQKRFLGEIEQGIRLANREIIHSRIPKLSRDGILQLAIVVGRLRARYLEAALALGISESVDHPEADHIHELRTRREMYEEALKGFDALRHAIERGYIDAGELK